MRQSTSNPGQLAQQLLPPQNKSTLNFLEYNPRKFSNNLRPTPSTTAGCYFPSTQKKIEADFLTKAKSKVPALGRTDINLNIKVWGLKRGNPAEIVPCFVKYGERVGEIEERLQDQQGFLGGDKELYYDNLKLDKNYTVEDLELENGDLQHLKSRDQKIFSDADKNRPILRKFKRIIGVNSEFVNSGKIPSFDRSAYTTEPSYLEMCRMSENELASVANFTIWNQHGEVGFKGRSDIRGLNLEKIIRIEKKSIEVFPSTHFSANSIPQRGLGLNRAAVLKFKNFRTKKQPTKDANEKFLIKVKKWILDQPNAEFLDYNFESEELSITVDNFSRKN